MRSDTSLVLRQILYFTLILIMAFLLAVIWEFMLEPMFGVHLGIEEHAEMEDAAERWEYVLTATAFVFLAIQLPFLLSLRAARQQAQAARQLRQAAAVFDYIVEAVMVTDANGSILTTNPAFSKLTGYRQKEVIGKPPTILNADYSDPKEYIKRLDEINRTGYWRSEHMYRNKAGRLFPVKEQVSVIRDDAGQVINYLYIFSDITEIKSSWDQLQYQAQHDHLTGLPNRLLLDASIEQAIKRARREAQLVAVVYFDIDDFKQINDTLSHEAGDQLLRQVAERLPGVLREQDLIARVGGDEFVILLEELENHQTLTAVIEKIQRSFEEPWQVNGHALHATASMGVSLYPDNGEESTSLIQKADLAMYSAKKAGANRFHIFREQ